MIFRKQTVGLLLFLGFVSTVFSGDYEKFREFYKVENHKEGLPYIEAAYNKNPENAKFRYFYAMTLYRLGQFKKAILIFEKKSEI